MSKNKRNQGNTNIPFKRDPLTGQILFSDKHRAYVRDIINPKIRFIEAEGAVRAGKDVYGLAGYAKVLDMHENTYHLAVATTIAQAQMLIIDADGFGIMHHFPNGYLGEVKDKTAFIFTDSKGREKYLIVAGGMNENSYKSIRGLNYGSVYVNESNLLHINTLEECKRRIMASTMPKFIMTQNPDSPASDFYDKFETPLTRPNDPKYYNDNPNNVWNGPSFRYHHFLQYDNPALSLEQIKENYESFASEVDRQRNFDGLRVAAEGAVYDMITDSNFYEDGDGTLTEFNKINFDRIILIDVGTTNPQIYIDTYVNPETFDMYLEREYRWDSVKEGRQKTDGQYAKDLQVFIRAEYDGAYNYIIVDPAAASFKAEMGSLERPLTYIDADNTIMGTKVGEEDTGKKSTQGVKLVQVGFAKNKIHINKRGCVEGIKELRSYKWDVKARERGVEMPLKSRDHFPDALRYGVNTHVKYSVRWGVKE